MGGIGAQHFTTWRTRHLISSFRRFVSRADKQISAYLRRMKLSGYMGTFFQTLEQSSAEATMQSRSMQ